MNSTSVIPYVKLMQGFMLERAAWLATPNMLFPWGSDFEFQNSTAMYLNMDVVSASSSIQPHIHCPPA